MDSLVPSPLVDIVIPVHSSARPLERAVRSALRASEGAAPGQCRVVVVAHHLSEQEVLAMLSEPLRDAVTVLECEGRGSTAAVPRNEALRWSTARYVSFLDSDDTLDPGAVSRWLGIAERRGSDLVIPFQHHEAARADITPITRPLRSARLDPVKDRLGYRSSAFGLVRLDIVRTLGASFDETVRTGEDQAFVMALYTRGSRIDYAPGTPGYLVHADADVRVSQQPLPLREEVAAALDLGDYPWFPRTPTELRASHVLKYLRVNFFPAVQGLVERGEWSAAHASTAWAVALELLHFAPNVEDRLARADRRVLALLQDSAPEEDLRAALTARRRFASPGALLTTRARWFLDRQSPLRVAVASAVQLVRYRMGNRSARGE
ncbi:glycosyltransferase [Kocuria tytonicola]|uniref:Glycosyltransferase n=1 Tax=Kocuria tytonicola TaxID=2055946 RepID=A0A3L9KYS9_9MICC|nr:glycosyltransferase [Kocuria tytonicola]RLY91773.1 glycosyltransferase [Kocuria tytonicola]